MAQDPIVPKADRHRHHRDHANREPQQLGRRHAELDAERARARQILGQPVQHDDADSAHRPNRRQEQLVAAMAEGNQQEVRTDDDGDVADGELHRPRLERAAEGDVGDGETQRDQHDDGQQEAQLRSAPGDAHQVAVSAVIDRGASGRDRWSARRRS